MEYVLGGEFEYATPAAQSEAAKKYEDDGLLPLNPEAVPISRSEARRLVSDARNDTADMLSTLRPRTDEEAACLKEWKSNKKFTVTDAVNFRVYEALSVPTLSYKVATVGMCRQQLARLYGGGMVHWRHGPRILQEGWYDASPEVSEIRITPDAAENYEARRARLHQTVGQVATQHGSAVYLGTEHINGSVYRGEQPVLVDPTEDNSAYRAIARGLMRLYLDGMLLDPQKEPMLPARLDIGPWRESDIRMLPGRVELPTGTHSPDRKLGSRDPDLARRFLLAGMRLGLEGDTSEVPDRTVDILQVSPDVTFDRERDHSLIRCLQGMICRPNLSENPWPWRAVMAKWPADYEEIALHMPKYPELSMFQEDFKDLTLSVDANHLVITEEALTDFKNYKRTQGGDGWDTVTVADLEDVFNRVKVSITQAVMCSSEWSKALTEQIRYTDTDGRSIPGAYNNALHRLILGARALPTVDPERYAQVRSIVDALPTSAGR